MGANHLPRMDSLQANAFVPPDYSALHVGGHDFGAGLNQPLALQDDPGFEQFNMNALLQPASDRVQFANRITQGSGVDASGVPTYFASMAVADPWADIAAQQTNRDRFTPQPSRFTQSSGPKTRLQKYWQTLRSTWKPNNDPRMMS